MKRCLICKSELRTGTKFCSKECKSKSQKGKKPWNYGLTKETSDIVKKYSESGSKTILKQFNDGRVVHNKGKNKETYDPCKRTSEKNSVNTKLQYQKTGKEKWMNDRKNFTRKGTKNSKYQKSVVRNYIIKLRKEGRIKHKDTGIEVKIENILNNLKLKYIIQPSLKDIGTPDFYLIDYDTYVYCDGCYWHGCEIHCPKRKKQTNKYRRVNKKLDNRKVKYIRFWEHDINNNEEFVLSSFKKLMI